MSQKISIFANTVKKKSHFDLTLTAPSQNRTLSLSGAALGKSPGR